MKELINLINYCDMLHKNIFRDLTNRYGAHLPDRFKKFNEEVNELNEACETFSETPTIKNAVAMLAEIGDVLIILHHICAIMGVEPDRVIEWTHAKIQTRDTNPDFMHEEPKKKRKTFRDIKKGGKK